MLDYTPEQWAQIHASAKDALRKNPQDGRARAWFQAAEQFMVTQRQAANAADVAATSRGPIAAGASGAADVMSFGLGPKIAQGMYPNSEKMIQGATRQQHRVADIVGKVLGFAGPAGIEAGVIKGARVAPTVIGKTVQAISNRFARGAAKTALRGVEGAAYGAAQAAGHDEPIGTGAAIGGVAAAGLPLALGAGRVAFNRAVTRPVKGFTRALSEAVDRVAGSVKPREVPLDFDLLPAGRGPVSPSVQPTPSTGLLGQSAPTTPLQAAGIPEAELQSFLAMSAKEWQAARVRLPRAVGDIIDDFRNRTNQ